MRLRRLFSGRGVVLLAVLAAAIGTSAVTATAQQQPANQSAFSGARSGPRKFRAGRESWRAGQIAPRPGPASEYPAARELPPVGELSGQTRETGRRQEPWLRRSAIRMCGTCTTSRRSAWAAPIVTAATRPPRRSTKPTCRPAFPQAWATSANPVRSYALLNHESPEFVRFVNPGDLRVAAISCGNCHPREVLGVRKSMMTHGCMLWGSALYNNGAVPNKAARYGESYSMLGSPQRLQTVPPPSPEEIASKGRRAVPRSAAAIRDQPAGQRVANFRARRAFSPGGRHSRIARRIRRVLDPA